MTNKSQNTISDPICGAKGYIPPNSPTDAIASRGGLFPDDTVYPGPILSPQSRTKAHKSRREVPFLQPTRKNCDAQ